MHRPPPTAAMLAAAIAVSASVAPLDADAQAAADPSAVQARYEALGSDADHAGLVALWSEFPESAVPVIDRDLEGSLALWEEAGEEKRAEIEALLARAVRGAEAATEATGRRRILDYVTSFAGWNEEQNAAFRAGQQACGEGRRALAADDAATALGHGRNCQGLAEPLGDWWGTAMGLQLEGSALAAQGHDEAAATALARGRLIYRELGLTASALRIEADLAPVLLRLGRVPRAEAMIRDGRRTAERLDLEPLVERFRELEAALARRP